jgi:hypothetical protein
MVRLLLICFYIVLFYVKSVIPHDMISELKNKSVFFTALEGNFVLEENNFEMELKKPHKTDCVIIKLEKEIELKQGQELNLINTLSVIVSKFHYEINICLEREITSRGFDNRNLNLFFTRIEKTSESNLICFKRIDYFNDSFTREKFNARINTLNHNDENDVANDVLDISELINIDFTKYSELIISYASKYIAWNDYSFYELVFIYDEQKHNFNFTKLFYYFSKEKEIQTEKSNTNEQFYYISLINKGKDNFDHIFINYKNSRKILKYSKNYKNTNEEKLSMSDFSTSTYTFKINIKTKSSDSIYHNQINLKFPDLLFEKKNQNGAELCLFLYQHLTEDTYIEKNEFLQHLSKRHLIEAGKFEIIYSPFIDQELSSDLSQQYYLSLLLCDSYINFKHLNFEFSYPIHFRYQPAIPGKKTHQEVLMPYPYSRVFSRNSTDIYNNHTKALYEDYLSSYNILDKDSYYVRVKREKNKQMQNSAFIDQFNERAIFYDEINLKISKIINHFINLVENRNTLLHYVPAGRLAHFWFVSILTILTTAFGIMIIFYGLISYLLKGKEKVE